MHTTIPLSDYLKNFAENKDIARMLRREKIVPALQKGHDIILDFSGIEGATQSFVHALISELIREYGSDILERMAFKNCSETVKKIIGIVVDYMQQRD